MKYLHTLSLLLVVAFSGSLLAKGQPLREGYYPKAFVVAVTSSQLKDENLKRELHAIISKNHQSLDYTTAREVLFGKIHLDADKNGYYVKDVYCGKLFRTNIGVGENRIPNSNILNCEHTWPQSKFTSTYSRSLQKGDLHHLYPTDNKANSTRGNYPFADVDGESLGNNCDDSRIGSAQTRQSRGTYFEPPAEHKGNVARALFYFSVRYKLQLDAIQEANLRQWHIEDPVDAEEMERNDIIFQAQGNRNPFIDSAELVDLIADF